MLFLISLFYAKFVIQIVLDIECILLDYLLYLILIFVMDYTKVYKIIFYILFIAVISFINPAARNIFLIFYTFYVLSEISTKVILKFNIIAQLIVFLTCTLFISIGITEPEMFRQSLMDMRVRYDYGMGNPNTFSLFVYSIILNIYILYGWKSNIVVPLLLVVSVIVYRYTGTRSFILSVFFLGFAHYIARHIRIGTFVRNFLILLPGVVSIMIIFLVNNVSSYEVLNVLLSGRLGLYDNFISSISSFDILLGTQKVNQETIDSAFFHLMFEAGLVAFILFYYIYYKSIKKAGINDLKIFFPLYSSLFSLCITESVLTFILMFGNMIVWQIMFRSYRGLNISDDLSMSSAIQ